MLSVHSLIGTWNSKVNQYVLLTEFARNKFMEAGFPADRMVVRQNFVPYDLGPGKGDGGFVLYVGRLSREKGILELLRAWQDVRRGKLIIVGNGNLRSEVEEAAADSESIQYLGNQPLDRVFDLMGASRALVFPSIWYEGMPRVIIESFSRGTPVLASRMGSMEEMILPHQTGWLVTPGRVDELSSTLQMILEPQADWSRQRALARQEFERHYTADIAYQKTMEIYTETIARHMRERV
jgi:glycosyltransferase involved in cell wall biosynthesis